MNSMLADILPNIENVSRNYSEIYKNAVWGHSTIGITMNLYVHAIEDKSKKKLKRLHQHSR